MQRKHRRPTKGTSRSKRSGDEQIDELVDTVCLEHGGCTCAELSCSAKCMRCGMDRDELEKKVKTDMKSPGRFGIIANYINSTVETRGKDEYTKALMSVVSLNDRQLIFGSQIPQIQNFTLWIRDCTRKSCTTFIKNGTYLLVGSANGFFQDSVSLSGSPINSTQILLQNYLLRDDDTLDGGDLQNSSGDNCVKVIRDMHFYH